MINLGGVQPTLPAKTMAAVPEAASVPPQTQAQNTQPADVVEISQVAHLAAQAQALPEVRADLVAQVKAEIAAGTYETPERLEIALDGLMDDLVGGV